MTDREVIPEAALNGRWRKRPAGMTYAEAPVDDCPRCGRFGVQASRAMFEAGWIAYPVCPDCLEAMEQ